MVDVPAVAVMVGAVIMEPVVQVMAVRPLGELINNPVGKVSEKLTPARLLVLGLVKVNLSVLASSCAMGSVANALLSVGGSGRGHPVMLTLSIYIVPVVRDGLPLYWAPSANILK